MKHKSIFRLLIHINNLPFRNMASIYTLAQTKVLTDALGAPVSFYTAGCHLHGHLTHRSQDRSLGAGG